MGLKYGAKMKNLVGGHARPWKATKEMWALIQIHVINLLAFHYDIYSLLFINIFCLFYKYW